MALIYCYGDNKLADACAKEAAEELVMAYPNHSWWVECKGGVLCIKHFAISRVIGMVLHISQLASSSRDRKRSILNAAGELLERAGLERGAYRGQVAQNLDAPGRIKRKFHVPISIPTIH